MGGILKSVTKLLGLGGDSDEIAKEMRRQAEAQANQLREDSTRQAEQLKQNAKMTQMQQEQMARNVAAQEQARRLEEQAKNTQETVELGDPVEDALVAEEEEARKRNPRAQYMAPTGAYSNTGISLQI